MFSRQEIIKSAWSQCKNNIGLWLSIILSSIAILLILFQMFSFIPGEALTQQIIFIIAAILFIMGLQLGVVQLSLNLVKNKESGLRDLFSNFHLIIPATAIFIIMFIIQAPTLATIIFSDGSSIMGGLLRVFIIIANMYITIRLQLSIYYLVDQEKSILSCIGQSINATKGHVTELLIIQIILTVLSTIALMTIIGFLLFLPFQFMVQANIFISLSGLSQKFINE